MKEDVLMKKENFKKYILIFLFVVILVTIDQTSKIIVNKNINDESKVVVDGVLSISQYTDNNGMEQKNKISKIITESIVIAMILRFVIVQIDKMYSVTKISLTLILAGGISNLLDRFFIGYKVNFIDFTPISDKLPIINLSDIFIIVGFIIFAITVFRYILSLRKPVSNLIEEEKNKNIVQNIKQ